MKSPCKDCETRHYGCHESCKIYAEFYAERREICKKNRADGEIMSILITQRERVERDIKSQHHKRWINRNPRRKGKK